ncbi:TPA: hypothetical protein QDA88_005201 [Burkholderia vietnamiensis]|nr:hypothetical protein [Burkholderia vietnamiensis]
MSHLSNAIQTATISNPKLYRDPAAADTRIFPYYAGFSSSFVRQLLASLEMEPGSTILDPWNGSGTTTQTASDLGHRAIGIDLNPAMVVVAKARLLSPLDYPSLPPIAKSLLDQTAKACVTTTDSRPDPLENWLSPSSAASIRSLEHEINRMLISNEGYRTLNQRETIDSLSPLAAFFYVCLFRVTRKLLVDFIPSNPTWIKSPRSKLERKRPSRSLISTMFLEEVVNLTSLGNLYNLNELREDKNIRLNVGNAERLQLAEDSVDAIISSPPYCTRIDYAVSTAFELAVLGFSKDEFDVLRRSLTGTSTVERMRGAIDPAWGPKCLAFLEQLQSHPSVASKGYYFKNHAQYFRSLSSSVSEIARVLKPSGLCCLVAQDSHYKDIHNDVPSIISEMASNVGLELTRREDFKTSHSMVKVNAKSKRYLPSRSLNESVLVFRKQKNSATPAR